MQLYLSKVPDSVLAVNLKACNTFRLSTGRAAEEELQQLKSQMGVNLLANELIRWASLHCMALHTLPAPV